MESLQKVYALSTARAGSKSVRNKNSMIIKGKPLFLHNLLESMSTPEILDTFISTDMSDAIQGSDTWGYQVIVRPNELCQDHSTHTDTIKHGLFEIESRVGSEIDVLVVMLGNTINMDREIIAKSLQILRDEPETDSVVTVIRANHFNPIRAYVDDGKGNLTTFMTQEQILEKTRKNSLADKNSVGAIYFQNGLWILRRKTVVESNGIQPFPWFGTNIRYLEQDPRLQEIDDEYQIRLLQD